MEIIKLTIKEDFHRGTLYLFSFSYHTIKLFEKKYEIKLIRDEPLFFTRGLSFCKKICLQAVVA